MFKLGDTGGSLRRQLHSRLFQLSNARIGEFIEPDQVDLAGPAPFAKIFRFPFDPNHRLISCRLIPLKGRIAIVTDVGMGCGGRGSVVACGESQGGLSIERMSVSILPARGRTALLPPSLKPWWTCTCHQGLLAKAGRGRQNRVVLAPVAGAKSAEVLRAQPGARIPLIRRRGWQDEFVARESAA
jgi:hypothetical protein